MADLITSRDRSRFELEAISPAVVIERAARDFAGMAADAIAHHESEPERARRQEVAQRVAIEGDDWAELLRTHLKDYYNAASYRALVGDGKWVDLSDNPLRDISAELAVLYQQQPVRTIEGVEPDEAATAVEVYEGLFGEADGALQLQLFWGGVNVAVEAFEDVLIWPSAQDTPDGRRLVGRWAAGNSYSVIVDDDDPTLVLGVVLQLAPRGSARRYAYWTHAWYGVFEADEHGRGVQQVGPADWRNPYGRMPFVHIHNAGIQPASYWNTRRGQDLVTSTLKIGEKHQQLRYSGKMSSFKQGVALGPDVEKIPQQLRDEGALLRIQGENAQFITVDWQINFQDRLDVISAERQHVAASRGINPNRMKRTGDYQTATGAAQGDRGLIERRAKKAPIYAIAEQAFYSAAVIVGQHHNVAGAGKLTRKARLRVEHAPMAYPADPIKRFEIDEKEASLGIKSLVAIAREHHPEMSDEEAREFILENIALNAEIAKIKMQHAVAGDLTNRSSIDEENGEQGPAARDGLTPPGSPPVTRA